MSPWGGLHWGHPIDPNRTPPALVLCMVAPAAQLLAPKPPGDPPPAALSPNIPHGAPTGSSPSPRPRSSDTASGSCRTRPGACATPSSRPAPGGGTGEGSRGHVRPNTCGDTPVPMQGHPGDDGEASTATCSPCTLCSRCLTAAGAGQTRGSGKKKKEKRKGGWGAMAPRIRGLSHHLP